MVAARLANLPNHRPAKTAAIAAVTQDRAAKMLNVSQDSIQRARQVQTAGAPDLVQAVERGKIAVSTAATLTALPKAEQAEVTRLP